MPDIAYLISKWWKPMLTLMLVSVATAAILVFIQPDKYLSVATALPSNSALTDKSSIFNQHPERLYSTLGEPDELDRVVGTGQLDTIYLAVADQYRLWEHYQLKEGKEPLRYQAAAILRAESRIIKSDHGELKVKVWDTDKYLAPQLANSLLAQLNSIHRSLQNENNQLALESLQARKKQMQVQLDSNNKAGWDASLIYRVQEYENLISEYQLMLHNQPSALLTVEKARVSYLYDRPQRVLILVATGILSLFFSLLLAIILEKRKSTAV